MNARRIGSTVELSLRPYARERYRLRSHFIRLESIRGALFWAMPLLAIGPKYWIIRHYFYGSGIEVFDTGFGGLGDYARHLYYGNSFHSCLPPFMPSDPGVCVYATRMPGMPLLLSGLAKIVGTKALNVALAKTVVMALLGAGLLAVLGRDLRLTWIGLVVLYVIYCGPQALKHSASLDYEDGLLTDMAMCLAVCLCYLLRANQTESNGRRHSMTIIGVFVAAAMYLTKATALPALLLVVAAALSARNIGRKAKLVCLAVSILSLAGWGWHNLRFSNGIHLSSSWNGENLLRGNDTGAYRIYPEISLDRIMDSTQATLADGDSVPLGNYSRKLYFTDEWSWDAYYRGVALAWMQKNPATAFLFLLKKAWVTLFEIRHTPTYISATQKLPLYPPATRALMAAWMLVARLTTFALIGRALWDGVRRRQGEMLWIVAIVFAACLPYMLVFAYERHVVPILVFCGTQFALLYCVQERGSLRPDAGKRSLS